MVKILVFVPLASTRWLWLKLIKPLSTVLSSAVNKSQQHQEEHSWERWESNPGLLGEKQGCYLRAMQSPPQKKKRGNVLGLVNMKSKTASMLAIFMAARLRKKTPRIVSKGFERVRAFRSSSGSSRSKMDLHFRILEWNRNTTCHNSLHIDLGEAYGGHRNDSTSDVN